MREIDRLLLMFALAALLVPCAELAPLVSSQPLSGASVSAPSWAWRQEYENLRAESVTNLVQSSDGGYAFWDQGSEHGVTARTPSVFHKTDAAGNVTSLEFMKWLDPDSLVQTSDGGYTTLGTWSTYGTTYQHTPTLIHTDSQGKIGWAQNLSRYIGSGLVPTSDGGYAVLQGGGNTQYYPGTSKAVINKITSRGKILWNNTFREAANFSIANMMIQTSDGGYATIGSTSFNGSSDTPNLYFWLAKTDSHGNLQWTRQYGNGPQAVDSNRTQNSGAAEGLNRQTTGDNQGLSVTETVDGGFALAGIVYGESHSPYGAIPDTFIIKTDSQGNMEWNQTLSGYHPCPIIQTTDDGFAVAVVGKIIKTDSEGNVQWELNVTFERWGFEPYPLGLSSLIETSDGALAGLGTGTFSQPWWGTIYLVKTEPFLPLPPPPAPQQGPSLTLLVLAASGAAAAAIAIGALVYFRKHKPEAKQE